MTPQLECAKHIKFLKRHLALLPSTHQEHDPNKLAIIFYSIVGLTALECDVSKEYRSNMGWVRKHYVTLQMHDCGQAVSGFTGSLAMQIPSVNCINLPNTLFGLLICRIMKDTILFDEVLERRNVANFVGKCQLNVGSFTSSLNYKSFAPSPTDTGDLRFCYVAIAILHLIGIKAESELNKYIDVENLVRYILSQQCDVGGFGTYGEAHAGYTSCALSALSLLGKIDRLSEIFKERTISWLVSRQVSNEGCMRFQEGYEFFDSEDHGGFQGRENKFADTCYVFWCLNSLRILTSEAGELPIQTDLAKKYLISRTQNTLIGGFSKNDEDDPDLYHTCLAIAALSLLDSSFEGILFVPKGVEL